MAKIFEYYEVAVAVGEYTQHVVSRWTTLKAAKDDLKNHTDFYKGKGGGDIVRVEVHADKDGRVHEKSEKVYEGESKPDSWMGATL